MKMFNKGSKEVENTQEDEKPYVTENPNSNVTDIDIGNDGTVQDVPQVGNDIPNTDPAKISTPRTVAQVREQIKVAKEEQKIFGKFFQLDIGEEAIITVRQDRIDTFKTKRKDGELADQFRFYLVDIRAQDRQKTWDVYVNTADQILAKIEEGKLTMKIKCVANQTGGRKYIVEDAD